MIKPITLAAAVELFTSCEYQVNGIMVPVPKLRSLAREWFGKSDEQALDATAGHVLLALARAFIGFTLDTVYPADDWREEDGDVLWWHFPICEPPIVGAHEGMGTKTRDGEPTDCARLQREGWLTHWSKIPVVWELEDGTPIRVVRRFPVEE